MADATDLLNYAYEKNPVDFADTFNQLMQQRTQDALAAHKVTLAQSVYGESEALEAEDDLEDVGEDEFDDSDDDLEDFDDDEEFDDDLDDLDLDDLDLEDLDLDDEDEDITDEDA